MATGQGLTGDQRTVAERLFIAVRDGKVETVRDLLRKYPSKVDSVGYCDRTALTWASYNGHIDVVQILLEAGASINKKDDRGQSALHYAAKDGKVDFVKTLLQKGAQINSVDGDGNTPLFYAILRRSTGVIELLINHPEIDLSIKNKKGQNFLHFAIKNLSWLHDRGPNLKQIVEKLLKQIVEKYLQAGLDINSVDEDGDTPLFYAIKEEKKVVIELLINHPEIDLSVKNKKSQNLLHCAIENSWHWVYPEEYKVINPDVKQIVEKLLQAGLDINSVDEDGDTPLFYAIKKKNTGVIELLINHPEIDLSIKNKKGRNVLHFAIENPWWNIKEKPNLKQIVEKVFQAGLDINSVDEDGNTPLFYAINERSTEVVELLINHPEIDLSIKNKIGQHLLHCAIEKGEVDVVKTLLQKGAQINSVDEDGDTPLFYAMKRRNTEVIELLINHPEIDLSIKNKKGQNLLHCAIDRLCWIGEEKPKLNRIVEKLLQAGLDINSVNEDGNTPLFYAIKERNTEVIELLINRPEIDLSIENKKGQSLLHCASKCDRVNVVKTLLQRGAQINLVDGDGNTPSFYAIKKRNTEVIKLLINYPEIDLSIKNKEGKNLLHLASEWGKVDVVETLLQRRAQINSVDGDGNTPLFYAIRAWNTEVFELLINHPEIDLSIKNKQGQNVLHFASECDRVNVVKTLLQRGAHINSMDGDDNTPLFHAIKERHTGVIELLINHPEIDLSIKNKQGQHLLHCALQWSWWEHEEEPELKQIVEMLLQAGHDINSLDEDGNTPLFYAIKRSNTEVIELLINHPEIDLSIKNKQGQHLLHCASSSLWWKYKEKPKLKRIVEKFLQAGLNINSVDGDGNTPLFYAIWAWNTKVIELLINHPEIDLSIRNKQGQNLLHSACQGSSCEDEEKPTFKRILKKLLQAGLDINSVDEDGNTPLCYAIREWNTEVVELLINHPEIDLSIKNKKGRNLLHYACKCYRWEYEKPKLKRIVEKLLQAGLNINSVDEYGNTPLFYAIQKRNTEVFKLLINHPEIDLSIKNKKGQNLLHCASQRGIVVVVETLLQRGAQINSMDGDGNTPLFYAIMEKNTGVIELLINHPEIDLSIKNKRGQNLLQCAIENSWHEDFYEDCLVINLNVEKIVEKLLQAGLDINSVDENGDTPLFYAIKEKNTGVIERLINHPEIDLSIKNKKGRNVLNFAIENSGHLVDPECRFVIYLDVEQIVEKLLQAGLDVNSVDNSGNTPLHTAIDKKNRVIMKLLINNPKTDFQIKNKNGFNALHYAVLKMDAADRTEIVQLMLKNGAAINSVDNSGNTPLHTAIDKKNRVIMKLLINNPKTDFQIKNKNGFNALHYAVLKMDAADRTEVVQLMLQNGAAINSVDSDGNTVLHNAIYSGCKEVIEVLINHPNIDFSLKNKYGHNILHFAVMEEKVVNRAELIKCLLQKGARVNSVDNDGDTPLHNAIYREYIEVIKVLIDHQNIDFSLKNKKGFNALHFALMAEKVVKRPEIVRLLLQKGADVNSMDRDGYPLLHNAIYLGYTEIIDLLINQPQIDFSLKNTHGHNVLHFAILEEKVVNRLEIIQMLLQMHADINSVDDNLNTALHHAVYKGDSEIIKLLISQPQIDLSLKNNQGFNVLDCVLRGKNAINRLDVIKLLLQNMEDINYVDDDGNTPLHYAVYMGDTEVMELLINHPKTDFNLKNKKGFNVLDIALRAENVANRPELVHLMLAKGIDINSKDNDGNTALYYAVTTKDKEVVDVLINHPKIDFSLKNNQGHDVLYCALRGEIAVNRTEIIGMLLQEGAEINSVDLNGDTILHHAINDNDKKVIELLINNPKIDIGHRNKEGLNALHLAVLGRNIRDRTELMKQLLHKGADTNSVSNTGCTALHHAVYDGNIEAVELLIKQPKMDLSLKTIQGFTVLHLAVLGKNDVNRLELTQLLIQKGVPINSVDKDGDSPIHIAVNKGETEVTELLIDQPNIDLSLSNDKGFTVLSLAVLRNDLITTELLIDKHPSIINTKDGNGLTALHLAAHNGHDQIVSCLIEKSADLKLGNDSQQTPLMMAVKACQLSTVKLLVENGADLNVSDEDGDSCLHLAVRKYTASTQTDSDQALTWAGFTIACFLVRNGADVNIRNKEGMTAIDLIQDTEKRKNFEMLV